MRGLLDLGPMPSQCLHAASVLMARRSVIVVFILESEFELFFLNLSTGDALRHCRG